MQKTKKEWNKFERKFLDLDVEDVDVVEELADAFREWTEWNKSNVTIEVITPLNFTIILVVHDIFMDTKYEDSIEFLDSIIYVLNLYSDTDDRFEYMTDFWYNHTDLLCK